MATVRHLVFMRVNLAVLAEFLKLPPGCRIVDAARGHDAIVTETLTLLLESEEFAAVECGHSAPEVSATYKGGVCDCKFEKFTQVD